MDDEIKDQLNDVINALGATCEIVGFLKTTLEKNGFTHEEAVMMATKVLVELVCIRKEE